MALQFSSAVQNALLSALLNTVGPSPKLQLWTGVMPPNVGVADTGSKIAEFALAQTWMAAPANGQASLTNTPLSTTALATGTVSYFRLVDQYGTVHLQGTVGQNGVLDSSGNLPDFQIDNPNVTEGQTVVASAWAISSPGN